MNEEGLDVLGLAWVLLRVIVIIAVWVVLFLGVFLGYLTIPLLMLTVFFMLLSIPDLTRQGKRILSRARSRDKSR